MSCNARPEGPATTGGGRGHRPRFPTWPRTWLCRRRLLVGRVFAEARGLCDHRPSALGAAAVWSLSAVSRVLGWIGFSTWGCKVPRSSGHRQRLLQALTPPRDCVFPCCLATLPDVKLRVWESAWATSLGCRPLAGITGGDAGWALPLSGVGEHSSSIVPALWDPSFPDPRGELAV